MQWPSLMMVSAALLGCVIPDGKDACRTQADCLNGYHCHADGHCGTSAVDPGSSSGNAQSSSSSSGGGCSPGFRDCGLGCNVCPAEATQTACEQTECVATQCVRGNTPSLGRCAALFMTLDVTHLDNLLDDRLSVATFDDGRLMVAYTRMTSGTQNVRVAITNPDDSGPFQEEQPLCSEGDSLPCSHAWLTSCRGVPAALFLEEDSTAPPFMVRLSTMPHLIFTATTLTRGTQLGSPVTLACDDTGVDHLFFASGSDLLHHTWDGSQLSAPSTVFTGALQAAAAVDAQGTAWLVTSDGHGETRLHQQGTPGWMQTSLQTGNTVNAPVSGVDLLISADGEMHVCTQDTRQSPTSLVYIHGQHGVFSTEMVMPGKGSGRCRLARANDATIFISHVTQPDHHVLISRRDPSTGAWGTDDVDSSTSTLGPQGIALDRNGTLNVVYVSQAGTLHWAH